MVKQGANGAQPDAADNSASNDHGNGQETVGDIPRDPHDLTSDDAETKDRFDALVRDRDSLRAEVTDMRKSLEDLQSKHNADMETLQRKLEDAETKKEQAETQFQNLLERVNTIKSQLGERMKEDAVRWAVIIACGDFAHTAS